jgi:hypothetical protein
MRSARENKFRSACEKKEKKKMRHYLRTLLNQTSPKTCIRLFPYQMTIRLFIVTKMPTNSIRCFVRAHLFLDTFIKGAT